MTDPRFATPARTAIALLLALAAPSSPAGDPALRLARASADGAGGGIAEGATYTMVVAFGQHDAQPPAYGGPYAVAGGVFAALPADRLFVDGFE